MDEEQSGKQPAGEDRSAAMADLRRRLRRLGVRTGRDFAPTPRRQPALPLEEALDGRELETQAGTCYEVSSSFPLETPHGPLPLESWLALSPETIGEVGEWPGLGRVAPQDFIFLDTETTGLGGGALAFMVGIGFFNAAGYFEIHQFFLRNPGEERAMLILLRELIPPTSGLVTFNGQAFDVPLLNDRFIRARMRHPLPTLPNFDLLPPARRLWRRRLPSCSLGSLETHILGRQRDQADVPGYLIPALYREYLNTGDARAMQGVFYHNQQDLLSMVTLGALICNTFAQPKTTLPNEDRLSLARWYHNRDLMAESEAAYRAALDDAPDAQARYDALYGLAYLLKRSERRDEALPLWAFLADLKLDTVGHEELAKHYEWQAVNLKTALEWTELGIDLAESWRPGLRRTTALASLRHRRERLLRKLSAGGAGDE
ncbi:MAG: ribonuclease H-like domain-containing protein [Chloroflexota bacterium]